MKSALPRRAVLIRGALTIFGAMAASACQTGVPRSPATVPAALAPLFTPCAPADGGLALSAFKGGAILGNLDVAWKAVTPVEIVFEAQNALGMTMINGQVTGGAPPALSFTGPGAAKLPNITVLDDGFLAVDGDAIGFRADELACVLGFRLPRSWKRLVRTIDSDQAKTTLELGDERREITIVVKHTEKGGDAVCSKVVWTRYWFFHPSLTWCQTGLQAATSRPPRPEGSLAGVEDYLLKWVSADE